MATKALANNSEGWRGRSKDFGMKFEEIDQEPNMEHPERALAKGKIGGRKKFLNRPINMREDERDES